MSPPARFRVTSAVPLLIVRLFTLLTFTPAVSVPKLKSFSLPSLFTSTIRVFAAAYSELPVAVSPAWIVLFSESEMLIVPRNVVAAVLSLASRSSSPFVNTSVFLS